LQLRGRQERLGAVVDHQRIEHTEHGLVPTGDDGWFVLNATEARWRKRPGRGVLCDFEGDGDFPQLGLNLQRLGPGEPMSMYHWEADQEDFLVLAGEALLVIEGEEQALRQWDFVHCPAGTNHVIVGAGEGPCLVLAVGARGESAGPNWGAYRVDQAAIRHGAGVEEETTEPDVAYSRFPPSVMTRYQPGWLGE
jgi:uncharacterized cupin superfamily protein